MILQRRSLSRQYISVTEDTIVLWNINVDGRWNGSLGGAMVAHWTSDPEAVGSSPTQGFLFSSYSPLRIPRCLDKSYR